MANVSSKTGETPPLFEASGIKKAFGAVKVLHDLSIRIEPGAITALVGDNGAGKSTFVKCLTGVHAADSGSIAVQGDEIVIGSPMDARKLGIETVYQDLGLVETLPVWHNLHLNREKTVGRGPLSFLRRKRMSSDAANMLAALDINLPSPNVDISSLSGGQRQAVAISRAASWNPKLVIMDEPTAALGVRETKAVEDLIRRLRDRGTAVLIISHDMTQVLDLANHVTVLRQGVTASSREASELTPDHLVSLITGAKTDKEIFE